MTGLRIRNQQVRGSSPRAGSSFPDGIRDVHNGALRHGLGSRLRGVSRRVQQRLQSRFCFYGVRTAVVILPLTVAFPGMVDEVHN
jgi:hypothetical protein